VAALEKKLAGTTELSETESGAAIALVETDNGAGGPLVVDIAVIEPGPGNKKDGHYYPREMLAEHASVFKGVKMYTVRTEVSEILECPVDFTETGAPVARVGIFDETFAQNVRNRAQLGTLHNLNCSILAEGTARKGEVDGAEYKIVEAITQAQSVDWVTRAGAGGRALRLAEVGSMEEEVKTEETEEEGGKAQVGEAEPVTISETQPEPETAPEETFLAESDVQAALGESNLPDASKERLANAQYADADVLQAAITAEVAYVKKLTGSGRPFAQGASQVTQPEPRTEEEKVAEFNEIMRSIGAKEV
jgi:hypothetical protein